jgi:hypothetical protein
VIAGVGGCKDTQYKRILRTMEATFRRDNLLNISLDV